MTAQNLINCANTTAQEPVSSFGAEATWAGVLEEERRPQMSSGVGRDPHDKRLGDHGDVACLKPKKYEIGKLVALPKASQENHLRSFSSTGS